MKSFSSTPNALRSRARLHAVAAACALCAAAPAWADAVVDGFVTLSTGGSFVGGVGDFLFPNADLWVGFAGTTLGNSATGSVTFNGATQASFAKVFTARQQSATDALPLGDFNVLRVQGPGTKLLTQGVATGYGSGDIYVTNGGFIDGRSTACGNKDFNFFFCGSLIGDGAPSRAALEVSGPNSRYETRDMRIAFAGTRNLNELVDASVDVLDGGTLRSWNVSVGSRNGNSGTETALGIMRINGANSLWVVDGFNRATDGTGVIPSNTAPSIQAGTFAGGTGQIFVENGGTLRIERADPLSGVPFMILGNGGTGQMRVTGAGSKVEFAPGTGGASLQLGRRAGSSGTLDVDSGGVITGLQYMAVGRAQFSGGVLDGGGSGTMVVDGAGSLVRLNDSSTTSTTSSVGQLDIGRGAGSAGTVSVRNGGRIEILGSVARPGGLTTYNGPGLLVGREAGDTGAATTFTGSGILNIQGAGSVVELRADVATNGVNPLVRIGRTGTGTGTLNLSDGGKLLIEGNAASTLALPRTTSFIVGGSANFNNLTGGNGNALISGAGSEVLMKGNDLFASVGDGPGGSGQLTISNGGKFTGTLFQVGRVRSTGLGDSANGTLTMNNGQMLLSGEFNSTQSNAVVGASMSIGVDAGSVGSVTMSNGSTLQIENKVLNRAASLFIGSNPNFSGSVGSLVMASGSSIAIDGLAGSNLAVGGSGGTGSLTMNASSITLAANGQANINGIAQLANGSSLNAGSFLGIAVSGGSGSLLINNSTVTATEVVIGAGGFLGGSGATVVGNVTNFGVFSPGASPGTFTIQGNYKAELNSKLILEVESDGSGGFLTDKVIFGGAVDLNGLDIEFKFLGNTDPNAFAGSGGFQIDTFLQKAGGAGLDDAAFVGVDFSASAAPNYALNGFKFDAVTGSNLAPVPEPGTWALMLGGLGVLAWARRRTARA